MRSTLLVLAALGLLAAGASRLIVRRPPPPPAAAPPPPARPVIEPLPTPREGFAGRWAGACSLTTKCPGEPQSVDEDHLDVTIAVEGTILTVTHDGCSYRFDVKRKVAVLRPGQRCAGAAAVDSWTLTLQADEQELLAAVTTRTSVEPGTTCVSRMRGVLTRR